MPLKTNGMTSIVKLIAITSLSSISPHILTYILNRLVLETLEPLSEDRKCFRLINGVLVERTVKDVKPALKTNQEGLRKVLDDLVKQYKTKQDDLEKWKVSQTIYESAVGFIKESDANTWPIEKAQRSGCPAIMRL